MTDNEALVMEYLGGRDWTSPTDIGWGIWHFVYNSSKASRICRGLVFMGVLVRNHKGHYKLAEEKTDD